MELWTTLLSQASQGQQALPERNVLILGELFCKCCLSSCAEARAGDSGCGKARLADLLVGRNVEGKWDSKSKGIGLDFRHCEVADAGGDVVGRLNVWRLQGDAALAAKGELLQCMGRPDLVLLCFDLAAPAEAALAGLERWHAAVAGAGWGAGPAMAVVGCRGDLLGDGPPDVLLLALREWCLAHGHCALVFCAAAHGRGAELLRRLVRGLPPGAEPEPEDPETLFVPAGWDSPERLATLRAPPAALPTPVAVAPAAAAAAAAAGKGRREEEVEAEPEQAFLLRHARLLEALREEEMQQQQQQQEGAAKRPAQAELIDAPGTPLSASAAPDPSLFSPAPASAFSTPVRTPLRPPAPSSSTPSIAALADGDHAGISDFFDSLLSKDKSPHKAVKPK